MTGVRIGDTGVARNGSHKTSYTQGIDIKDSCQIINWVTPEGGSGPNCQNL